MTKFTVEELAVEEWRDVVGYDGYYSVSGLGRVRRDIGGSNTYAGRILKPCPSREYSHVRLYKSGHSASPLIHSLVLAAFVGPCPEGKETNHIDRDPKNNRLNNLEYLTHPENIHHSLETRARGVNNGAYTHPESRRRGELNGQSKLTEQNVLDIRQRYIKDKWGLISILAKEFKVSRQLIRKIAIGEAWAHVK